MKSFLQLSIQFLKGNSSFLSSSICARRFSISFDSDEVIYATLGSERAEIIKKKLTTNRFVPIESREERGLFSLQQYKEIMAGKYQMNYRGLAIMKGPLDVIVFQQLFWQLKPRTVIELGTYNGTCALWVSDTMKLISSPCKVYTIDVDSSLVLPEVRELAGDSVSYMQGDANNIDREFPPDFMKRIEHPLVVLEDCHTNLEGVIKYFDQYMETGDYFVIDDTNPISSKFLYLGDAYTNEQPQVREYEPVGPGKLNCLKEVISGMGGKYALDTYFTDMFGYNSTNNWDSFLRKMKDN